MKIKACRVCGSKNLLKILSLGNQYLSDFVKTNKKPKSFPLSIFVCKRCLLVQLDNNAPQKYLYTERYGYKSGINQTMKDELKGIANESLRKIKKTKDKVVAVDIGANDGTLLSFYPKSVHRVSVEPVKKLAKESKKYANEVVNDYFTYEAYSKHSKNLKADIVSAISCFYDMEEPNKFVEDVKKIMKDDGIFVIQQNYLVEMLRKNAFDNIVHEHLEYYSLLSLNNLLARHNLEVFDVELRDLNGGSFRTYIAQKGKRRISKNVLKMQVLEKRLRLTNKKVYKDFAKRIKENKEKILNFIKKEVKRGKTIYLYGASTRGNTLLQYLGLGTKYIPFAVERNPEKWGKKIASVGIPIISEEKARKDKPDYMLVLPWFFKTEFLKREGTYLKGGGHFIFPLPKIDVV
ncbi:MAG: methyltransferase domain-containing protein [Candidatus Levybacteria bacterium]|nr:methyltransferase domain-containing protein [Candidatus Levybacteria bacterium]